MTHTDLFSDTHTKIDVKPDQVFMIDTMFKEPELHDPDLIGTFKDHKHDKKENSTKVDKDSISVERTSNDLGDKTDVEDTSRQNKTVHGIILCQQDTDNIDTDLHTQSVFSAHAIAEQLEDSLFADASKEDANDHLDKILCRQEIDTNACVNMRLAFSDDSNLLRSGDNNAMNANELNEKHINYSTNNESDVNTKPTCVATTDIIPEEHGDSTGLMETFKEDTCELNSVNTGTYSAAIVSKPAFTTETILEESEDSMEIESQDTNKPDMTPHMRGGIRRWKRNRPIKCGKLYSLKSYTTSFEKGDENNNTKTFVEVNGIRYSHTASDTPKNDMDNLGTGKANAAIAKYANETKRTGQKVEKFDCKERNKIITNDSLISQKSAKVSSKQSTCQIKMGTGTVFVPTFTRETLLKTYSLQQAPSSTTSPVAYTAQVPTQVPRRNYLSKERKSKSVSFIRFSEFEDLARNIERKVSKSLSRSWLSLITCK